jgi:hypothetical protein
MSEENEIYENIINLQKEKTEIDKKIKELKEQLDELVIPERDREIKIVHIPEWVEEKEEYINNRFSVYDLVSVDDNIAKIEEKEEYVPKKMEFADGGQFYRRISKGKVSIDLNELQNAYPDIFCEIVSLYPEIDQAKIERKLEEDPEFLSIIEEVIKMEKPSVSSVVSKSRKRED